MLCQKRLLAFYLVHTQVKMKVKVSVINIFTSAMDQITPCCMKYVVYLTQVSLCYVMFLHIQFYGKIPALVAKNYIV